MFYFKEYKMNEIVNKFLGRLLEHLSDKKLFII